MTSGWAVGSRSPDGPGEILDVCTAALRFESGAVGSFSNSCLLPRGFRIGLELAAPGLGLWLTEHQLAVSVSIPASTRTARPTSGWARSSTTTAWPSSARRSHGYRRAWPTPGRGRRRPRSPSTLLRERGDDVLGHMITDVVGFEEGPALLADLPGRRLPSPPLQAVPRFDGPG